MPDDKLSTTETKRNDGGPSFSWPSETWPGMTLRDYFAGQALAGMMARGIAPDFDLVPKWAYDLADRMLKECAK